MLVSIAVMHDDDGGTAAFLRLVGRRVKASREAGGLTQSRLEREAGLRPTTIAALERGEQDLDVYDLYRVAGALGVDMRALLPSDEEIVREARPDGGNPGGGNPGGGNPGGGNPGGGNPGGGNPGGH
jgi:DNA-binding XRE family transcriptional regulator